MSLYFKGGQNYVLTIEIMEKGDIGLVNYTGTQTRYLIHWFTKVGGLLLNFD